MSDAELSGGDALGDGDRSALIRSTIVRSPGSTSRAYQIRDRVARTGAAIRRHRVSLGQAGRSGHARSANRSATHLRQNCGALPPAAPQIKSKISPKFAQTDRRLLGRFKLRFRGSSCGAPLDNNKKTEARSRPQRCVSTGEHHHGDDGRPSVLERRRSTESDRTTKNATIPHTAAYDPRRAERGTIRSPHDPIPLFLSDPTSEPDPREFARLAVRDQEPDQSAAHLVKAVLAASASAVRRCCLPVRRSQPARAVANAKASVGGGHGAGSGSRRPGRSRARSPLKDPTRVTNPMLASADTRDVRAAPSREAIATAYQTRIAGSASIADSATRADTGRRTISTDANLACKDARRRRHWRR